MQHPLRQPREATLPTLQIKIKEKLKRKYIVNRVSSVDSVSNTAQS